MKNFIKFLKKSMSIALLCLAINTSITAIPSPGLTVMPSPDPCSTCGDSTPAISTDDPIDLYDYN